MGIGIGIFLGLVFVGTIYLYTQTKDSWNWRKIWKRVGIGFLALILIPLVLAAIAWVYSSISDYYASKPKVISSLHGLTLGEKFSDVEFKLPLKKQARQWNPEDMIEYDVVDQKNREISFDKNNKLIALGETCTEDKGPNAPLFESINGIGCGATSDDIVNRYGKGEVRIQCPSKAQLDERKDDKEIKFRVYDAIDYGVRYHLGNNYMFAITITTPSTLKGWSGKNWIPCDEAEKLSAKSSDGK